MIKSLKNILSRNMVISFILLAVLFLFGNPIVPHAGTLALEIHDIVHDQNFQDSTQSEIVLSFADPLQDNMVVQQNQPFKVWGKAPAGKEVTIYADWLSNQVVVTAGTTNSFLGIIQVPKTQKGDFTKHHIRIETNESTKSIGNLLIGDVWLLSGQSNMQFGMDEVDNSEQEIAAANYPNIRLLSTDLNFSADPVDSIGGVWKETSPQTVEKFSAVGYYFGQRIHNELDIPIGLIFSGIGASAVQAFVPQDVLAGNSLLDSVYLQPYLQSERSEKEIDAGFTFEKVMRPFLLYNAMIHPLTNLSIKGFCWYQGETNWHDRSEYTVAMYALVNSWRTSFEQGNLPFYYVQVAPYDYGKPDPKLAGYAFFREHQENISRLNNTEMVVTMDVGESKDLHPTNKRPIGVRLARTALNRTYSQLDITYKGPHFESVEFKRDTAIVTFEPETVASGLQTNDGQEPKHFMLAGKDKVFYQATAEIKGEKVYAYSVKVDDPVAVRYAFTNYPVTNLENGEGLPAVPFRSDSWVEKQRK